MPELAAFLSLFSASFLAATLLPGASEVLLVTLIVQGAGEPLWLIAIAGIGNTLGSVANWLCGRFLLRFADRRWFPVSSRQLEQASRLFNRYGVWTLLFAWVPVAGDALTVVAGVLRVPLPLFVCLVGAGKFARYLAIAGAVLAWPVL